MPILSLGAEPDFTVKLQGNYEMSSNLLLRAFVSYDSFSFGQFERFQSLYEPHSTTTDTTLDLGIGYSFAGV